MPLTPRPGQVVENPTTGKQYLVIGPADEIWKGQLKSKTNIKTATRLWVLCGMEWNDRLIIKDLASLRAFATLKPGFRVAT